MIKREKIALDTLQANLKKYIAAQPERVGKVHEKTQQLNQELMRLSITYNMVEANPIEMRDILRQMIILQEQGATMVAPIKEEYDAIVNLKKTLTGHQAEYENLARDDSLQAARKAIADHAADIKKTIALLEYRGRHCRSHPEFDRGIQRQARVQENTNRERSQVGLEKILSFSAHADVFHVRHMESLEVCPVKLVRFLGLLADPVCAEQGRHCENAFQYCPVRGGHHYCVPGYFRPYPEKIPLGTGRPVPGFRGLYGVRPAAHGAWHDDKHGDPEHTQFYRRVVLAAGLVSLGWNLRSFRRRLIHYSGITRSGPFGSCLPRAYWRR